MENRGQYIRQKIKTQGFTIGQVAEDVKKTPTTLSNYFKNPDLPWKVINIIGEAIGYDFKKDYPELAAAAAPKPMVKTPKKRGRKPGSKNKKSSKKLDSAEPKKRGRKKKEVAVSSNNIDWHVRYEALKSDYDKLTRRYISMLEKLAKVE
jgi:hypothetical protein